MIVDSSVLVAVLRGEPGSEAFARAIATAESCCVPAPCYLETCMVMAGRNGADGRAELDALLAALAIRALPLTEAHARLAAGAFLRYGKGRHPAALNFGDCMAYAVAQAEAAPLLFAGEDFARTDVGVAQ